MGTGIVVTRARDRAVEAYVIVRSGDFPDDDDTSDHRPVVVRIEMGTARGDP